MFYILTVIVVLIYMLLGIGTSRAFMKIKRNDFSMLYCLMWPFALIALCFYGDVD